MAHTADMAREAHVAHTPDSNDTADTAHAIAITVHIRVNTIHDPHGPEW